MTHVALIRVPAKCACGEHGFVPLTLGLVAIIDAEDVERCARKKWNAQPRGHGIYARTTDKRSRQYLHRFILSAAPGEIVDHINRDTLDNRRSNLRIATPSESMLNTVTPSKTGFKGVRRYSHGFYAEIAQIGGGAPRHLGCYDTAEEAAVAYDIAAEADEISRHTNTSLGRISTEMRKSIGVPVPRKRGAK